MWPCRFESYRPLENLGRKLTERYNRARRMPLSHATLAMVFLRLSSSYNRLHSARLLSVQYGLAVVVLGPHRSVRDSPGSLAALLREFWRVDIPRHGHLKIAS